MKPSTLMRKNPLIFVGLFILAVILFIAFGSRADDHRYEYPVSVLSVDTSYVTIPPDSLKNLPPDFPVYYRDGVCKRILTPQYDYRRKTVFVLKGKLAASPADLEALVKVVSTWVVPDSMKLDTTISLK